MNKIVSFVFLITFYEFGFGQQSTLYSAHRNLINNTAHGNIISGNFKSETDNLVLLDSMVTYVFSGIDSVRQYKTLYGYDAAGKTISKIQYAWSQGLKSWVISSKEEYSYNENGKPAVTTVLRWDSGSNNWIFKSKYENSYDESGKLLFSTGYAWQSEGENWIYASKEECSYNVTGNRIQETQFEWNAATNDWIKYSKNILSYYGNGKLSLKKSLYWDAFSSRWIFVWYDAYEYNKDGNLLLKIGYVWNLKTDNWIEFEKNENIYNSTGNQVFQLNYFWNDDLFDWKFSSKSFYHYSFYTVDAKKTAKSEMVVYPNPASGFITFAGVNNLTEIRIYTVDGQWVKTLQPERNTADVSDLSGGIYFIMFILDGKKMVAKMFKE